MRHSISRVNFREDDEILLPPLVISYRLDDFQRKSLTVLPDFQLLNVVYKTRIVTLDILAHQRHKEEYIQSS